MNRLVRLLTLALCCLGLNGQGRVSGPKTELGDRWVLHAAQGDLPAFRSQVSLRRRHLHVHVHLDPEVAADGWGVQVWVADPRVVAARKSLLASSRTAVRSLETLEKKQDALDPECRAEFTEFAARARGALDRIRNYDPIHQAILVRGEALDSPGLQAISLKEDVATDGTFFLSADIDLDGKVVIETLRLPSIVYHMTLVPHEEANPLPVAEAKLRELRFTTPLDFEPLLQGDLRMLGRDLAPVGLIYFPSRDGYIPHKWNEVRPPDCLDAVDLLPVPDVWMPCRLPMERHPPEGYATGWRFWTLGGRVLVRPSGRRRAVLLDFPTNRSDDPGDELTLVDARSAPGGFCLLLRLTYSSRPDTPGGYCGAGTESELLWMRLDREGRIRSSDGHLIESCFMNRTLDDYTLQEVPAQPGRLVWVITGPLSNLLPDETSPKDQTAKWGTQSITYDLAQPGRGLVKSRPTPTSSE